ncbi:MAG: hypothetical protein N3E51_00100 [Candidatus Micrarchaeota archaeon]|nr:hypothetical protein [Candidatus Micrarchaeota archaeon]
MSRQERKKTASAKSGFLMTLEAATAFILLLAAAASLQAFSPQPQKDGDFYLCADAAVALSKMRSFSSGSLDSDLNDFRQLSGLCFAAEYGAEKSASCETDAESQTVALSFPVYDGLGARKATLRCWR